MSGADNGYESLKAFWMSEKKVVMHQTQGAVSWEDGGITSSTPVLVVLRLAMARDHGHILYLGRH